MTYAVTRIISFFIIAFFLALGSHGVIILCLVLTFALYITNPPDSYEKLIRSILRMKWFFLSILVVYLLINTTQADLASRSFEGIKRVIILVNLMLLVSWLINKTPRDEILSGLIFLLSPLRYFGFPVKSFALRIELIFRNLEHVQEIVEYKKANLPPELNKISTIGKVVSGSYFDIIDVVDSKPLESVEIRLQQTIPPLQWLFPMGLFIMIFTAHLL